MQNTAKTKVCFAYDHFLWREIVAANYRETPLVVMRNVLGQSFLVLNDNECRYTSDLFFLSVCGHTISAHYIGKIYRFSGQAQSDSALVLYAKTHGNFSTSIISLVNISYDHIGNVKSRMY